MTQAVFLDALGTLVELEPPWAALRERVPAEVSDERLVAAVRAEMAYYKEHSHEGTDPESLADLRERCADLLSRELGVTISAEELVAAVRISAVPDAEPALRGLRQWGKTLVVVSNWDCSLRSVMERCGLGPLLDGVVSSAEAGARKPDPKIFEVALGLAGVQASEAIHVGDTPEEDVEGARAAGIRPLLIGPHGEADIASLLEIQEHLSG